MSARHRESITIAEFEKMSIVGYSNRLKVRYRYIMRGKKIIKIRQIVIKGQYHKNRQRLLKWRLEHHEDENTLVQIANFFVQHSQTCQSCSLAILKKDREQGAKIYNRVLFLNSRSQPALLFFAKQWFNKPGSKFRRAIERMIKLTGEKGCYAYLGHHHQARKNFYLAKKYFLKALPFIRSHYGIYYALAKLACEQSKKTECLKWSRRALRTYQKMPSNYKKDPATQSFVAELKSWTRSDTPINSV